VANAGVSGPLIFVDDLDAPVLDEGDRHHLERVLRLRDGALLTVSDGRGAWRLARFGSHLESTTAVTIDAPVEPSVTVGFALVKGERPEWIVQKLTEAGVDVIQPFTAARSIVRWDERKAAANLSRLRKVAREASMQCRRTRLPSVEPLATFAALADGHGVALAEPGAAPLSLRTPTILIGPEGGWTDDERAGRQLVGVAGPILRAETAAIAAGVLLGALRAGLVKPVAG
jgi:16S rRNA (uracil1498-N3)-methyltransferase